RAEAAARRADDPHSLARVLVGRAGVSNAARDYVAARRHLVGAVDIARGLGRPDVLEVQLKNLGWCEHACGDLDAAREHLEEARAVAESMGSVADTAEVHALLAIVAVRVGAVEAAQAHVVALLRADSSRFDAGADIVPTCLFAAAHTATARQLDELALH